ncbi:hypothetical protein AB6A40_000488 [Gnathostoma spinigerum]|uniref:Uncharacterized protein n=1 Tax=Gnathostoma spinigerum TaxID=75299 RepID=A0ABD6E6K6_9BILA
MESLGFQKIRFDAEDRPPSSYWQKNNTETQPTSAWSTGSATVELTSTDHLTEGSCSTVDSLNTSPNLRIKTKIDPQEWLKAPEFIPQSKTLLSDTFRPPSHTQATQCEVNVQHSYPQSVPFIPQCSQFPLNIQPSAPRSLPTSIDINSSIFAPTATIPFPITTRTRYQPPLQHAVPLSTLRFQGLPRLQNTSLFTRPPFSVLPSGYSANITQIKVGIGPPIPALILKKKRRKRHRRPTDKTNNSKENPAGSSTKPTESNGYCSEGEGISTKCSAAVLLDSSASDSHLHKGTNVRERLVQSTVESSRIVGGSCPDLSDSQLHAWDQILYNNVMTNSSMSSNTRNDKNSEQLRRNSAYDVINPVLLDAIDSSLHADGIHSKKIRELGRQLQGDADDNLNEDTFDRLQEYQRNPFVDSPASITKSWKAEVDELSLRPIISSYRYPQYNFSQVQSTFHPEYNMTTSEIVRRSEDDSPYVEDCFEGMHIRVNTFEDGDDLALSESELPPVSRFQQIQWALKRRRDQYVRLVPPPPKVCCSLM